MTWYFLNPHIANYNARRLIESIRGNDRGTGYLGLGYSPFIHYAKTNPRTIALSDHSENARPFVGNTVMHAYALAVDCDPEAFAFGTEIVEYAYGTACKWLGLNHDEANSLFYGTPEHPLSQMSIFKVITCLMVLAHEGVVDWTAQPSSKHIRSGLTHIAWTIDTAP